MDQLSAHLDRGWDLVAHGDARGARASARRALEIEPESPEALNLLGYAAAQEGDADEAIEHYRQAMAVDDGYIDPMLNAAEVLIHPLQRFDEALALCDEVLEFAEGQEEIADAILLKFDALLGLERDDEARRLLDDLPEGPFEGPMYPFLIGRAWYESGDVERAEPFLRDSLKLDAHNSDAHYYLGMVLEERHDRRGATLAFLEARELDMHVPPPPWSQPREQFHKSIERAISGLEPELLGRLEGALVIAADLPGIEVVAEGVDPRAPVLLDGLPLPGVQGGPLAERVFVYQRNIERTCGGPEQIEDEVGAAVEDEVRHALEHPEEGVEPSPSSPGDEAPATASRGKKKPRGKG